MKFLGIIYIFLWLHIIPLCAQEQLKFKLIETQGFKKSWVSTISQDTFGYLWLGTQDGLYRYDGYEMLSFRNHPYQSNSIPGNWVRKIDITPKSEIWMAIYGGGLSILTPNNLKFKNFNVENSTYGTFLREVKATQNGFIYLVSDVGVYWYNPAKDEFGKLAFGSISSSLEEVGETILVTSKDSLHIFNANANFQKSIVLNSKIRALSKLENGKVLVGTDNGLNLVQISETEAEIVSSLPFQNISNSFENKVYLSSNNQIYKYNSTDQKVTLMDSVSFKEASIQTLFVDKDGYLWVGTEKGLYKERKALPIFENPNVPYHIRRITKHNNTLYLAGNNGLFIQNNQHIENYFEEHQITSILVANEKLWMGTSKGLLLIFDMEGKLLNQIQVASDKLEDKNIYGLSEDNSHRIWVGSLEGIFVFNTHGEQLKYLYLPMDTTIKNQKIVQVLQDSKDRLWVATAAHGIFMLEDVSQNNLTTSINFKKFIYTPKLATGLSSNIILSIDEALDGTIWFGTDSGVVSFNEEQQNFEYLEINGHFFDKKVMAVKADLNNNLWITTIFDGLYLYNKDRNIFINYTTEDGLISNAFLFSSAYLDKEKNKLFFGTDEGLQQISLNKFNANTACKTSYISSLVTYKNSESSFNPIMNPSSNETFNLTYNNRDVTVNFSNIDYHQIEKVKYAYSFNGSQWVELPQRTAHFTNLSIGKNIIYYKTYPIGQDPKFQGEANKITFLVAPPWYRTFLAYVIYFLLISGIIVYIYALLLKNRLAKQKVESAELLDETKSKMYANISHEFKTPLTIIKGVTARLLKKAELPQKEKQSIVSIQENGELLLNLVNQMLELVTLDNKQLIQNYKKGDVVSFVKKCVALFSPFTDSKKQKLLFKSDIKSLTMDVDDVKLQKVINNLLSNAIKFTPNGGKINVTLKKEKEETLILEIEDTGKGIKTENLPHIFDRYFKTFDLDNNLGSGIGMELTKGLVQFMDGTISVESKEGEGSKFTVRLPIKHTMEEKVDFSFEKPFVASNLANKAKVENTSIQEKPVILIVEDNVEIRNYFKDLFEDTYQILETPNGKKALEISESRKVDFIISDVMMPVMNGFDFCKKIKSNTKTSHLPFIMVTAKTDDKSRLKGYKLGVDAYIEKPFNEAELVQIIENLLVKRKEQINFFRQILEIKKVDTKNTKLHELDLYFIKTIQEFALNNQQDKSMEALARQLLMSRTQLHRKIKQLTNMSITQYINHVKLEKAKKLLHSTSLTVSEIAYEIGFEDPKYFSKLFKKEQGKTPSSFREIP
ncbi:MAG: response regulator [Flavobacteriaceae bacterium]